MSSCNKPFQTSLPFKNRPVSRCYSLSHFLLLGMGDSTLSVTKNCTNKYFLYCFWTVVGRTISPFSFVSHLALASLICCVGLLGILGNVLLIPQLYSLNHLILQGSMWQGWLLWERTWVPLGPQLWIYKIAIDSKTLSHVVEKGGVMGVPPLTMLFCQCPNRQRLFPFCPHT